MFSRKRIAYGIKDISEIKNVSGVVSNDVKISDEYFNEIYDNVKHMLG